jgi:pimeloyl-ACP methyl ester carboxylesterase
MLTRLADKFVLQPTTDPIPTDGKTRQELTFSDGTFEVWVQRTASEQADAPHLFVLKFPGTGGRAERMSEHPAEVWQDVAAEIWTVNPPGYGTSGGHASLQFTAAVADAVYGELAKRAAGKPIVVTGNSLGCMAALYLAGNRDLQGLLLRNPLPLRQLIIGHHGWWNFGLSKFIANQVPSDICSIQNAARARPPALFITSERDRTIPPRYQQQIIDAYAGEHRVMLLPDADHATPIGDDQVEEYLQHLTWLRESVLQPS